MDTLIRPNGNFQVEPALFIAALRLGRFFGWESCGTVPPADWYDGTWEAWEDKSYRDFMGETVTAQDAVAWAAALERALDDIPDEDVRPFPEELLHRVPRGNELPLMVSVAYKLSPFMVFSGPSKVWLRALIQYLRGGGFRLEFVP